MPTPTSRSLNAGNVEFFLQFIDKGGPHGCWTWLGGKNESGYGSLNWRGRQGQRAHRVSYEIHVGPLKPEDVLRHSCDNPPCVNPAHLQPGTHADNTDDKIRRGRLWSGPRIRGERNPRSKLTEQAVREIKHLRTNGASFSEIGRRYGITHGAVRAVVNGETWGWVDSAALEDEEFRKSADAALRKRPVGDTGKEPERRECEIEGCDRKHYGRGWCQMHHSRWAEHGDPLAYIRAFEDRTKNRKCDVDGCGKRHHSKGYCIKHLRRFDTHGDPTKVTAPQQRRKRLVSAEVVEIRSSSESDEALAARFDISEKLVADVRAGQAYMRFVGLPPTTAA
jgi:hypothetical protein